MRVCLLVLDDVFDTGLSAMLDTFDTANGLASAEGGSERWSVTVCGMRRRAKTHHGLAVPLSPLPSTRPDVVVVPAMGAKMPPEIERALDRRDVADAGAALRAWSSEGALVAGACTATFVLGQSGILDGATATTTWWLSAFFRARFPAVDLDEARLIVESGNVVTAGTALAHLDLALWLVRRRSPALARATSRFLIYDERPSQAAYVMPDHIAHDDALVARFERWARSHLADFSIGSAARAVHTSERTLERRVRAVLGRSPLAFVQGLRVERAVHRLQTSDASLDEIAAQLGYQDGVALRALLRKKTGKGVRELRPRAERAQ